MDQKILDKATELYELAKKADLLTTENFSDVFPAAKLTEISYEQVAQVFVDFLVDTNKAFEVNYDQPVEDVIFNFKSVSSELSISDLGEKQEDGEWFQGMRVGDETFWYKSEAQGLVGEVLFDLGRKLFPLSKGIICTNFGDQNQYFVVDLGFAQEFTEFGFNLI